MTARTKASAKRARRPIYLVPRTMVDPATGEVMGALVPAHPIDRRLLRERGFRRDIPIRAELKQSRNVKFHRLAHAVVWVNPHKGREGYEPLTGGMQAALPSVDHLVAGHSLAAFQELAGVISRA